MHSRTKQVTGKAVESQATGWYACMLACKGLSSGLAVESAAGSDAAIKVEVQLRIP